MHALRKFVGVLTGVFAAPFKAVIDEMLGTELRSRSASSPPSPGLALTGSPCSGLRPPGRHRAGCGGTGPTARTGPW
jgi:hypothetical protein